MLQIFTSLKAYLHIQTIPKYRYVQFLHYNNNNKYRLEKVRLRYECIRTRYMAGTRVPIYTVAHIHTHRSAAARAKCAPCMNATSVLNAIVLYRTGSLFVVVVVVCWPTVLI